MGKVTKNISPSELSCPCCFFVNIQLETIDMFQEFADRVGGIKFNRVCNCPTYHASVYENLGLEVNWESMHLLGLAGDIVSLKSNHNYACVKAIEMYDEDLIGGLILYDDFIHMDKRRLKYFKDKRGGI